MNLDRLLRIFSIIHWFGLTMLALGLYLLWSAESPDVGSMTLYASLIGLGLLVMAPYPIVLFIRWSQNKKS